MAKKQSSPYARGPLKGSALFLLGHVVLLTLGSWVVVRFLLGVPLTSFITAVVTTTGAEWVMYVLLGLSMLAMGVVFERWRFYQKRAVDGAAARVRLQALLAQGNREEALALVRALPGMEGRVTEACLSRLDAGIGAMEEEMRAVLATQRLEYDKNLVVLGTLGNNAPFIGLFGTVLGIIKAFVDLSANVTGGAEAVMGGVSEALVATGVGILVAIPSVVAFNALKARVKGVVTQTESLARLILGHAKEHQTDAPSTKEAEATE